MDASWLAGTLTVSVSRLRLPGHALATLAMVGFGLAIDVAVLWMAFALRWPPPA